MSVEMRTCFTYFCVDCAYFFATLIFRIYDILLYSCRTFIFYQCEHAKISTGIYPVRLKKYTVGGKFSNRETRKLRAFDIHKFYKRRL